MEIQSDTFVAPLLNLLVSHVWDRHGSVLFLEFGALTPKPPRSDGSLSNPDGEMG